MELVGRTVVITGASSGVGRATAVELSRRACNVVLAGRREAALAQTAAMCESATLVCATDVTIEEDVARLTERALRPVAEVPADAPLSARAAGKVAGSLNQLAGTFS